jgi:hypothetical protein
MFKPNPTSMRPSSGTVKPGQGLINPNMGAPILFSVKGIPVRIVPFQNGWKTELTAARVPVLKAGSKPFTHTQTARRAAKSVFKLMNKRGWGLQRSIDAFHSLSSPVHRLGKYYAYVDAWCQTHPDDVAAKENRANLQRKINALTR